MPGFLWGVIAHIFTLLLSLRYKITIKGLDALEAAKLKKGILFLPNHPAHVDPLFLFLFLWPKFRMCPLVVESVFRLPILKRTMQLVRAVSIPDFETSINQLKVKKANDAIEAIATGLKKGENYVVYPAGKLKNTGREIIGAASGAYALVQKCPEAKIVLVRTSGLWGSSFSRALLGHSPHPPEILMKGIKTLLKNGIFFAPRRKVEIELAFAPKELLSRKNRLEFNRFLENWYNRYRDSQGKIVDIEPLQFVSYSLWKQDIPQPFHAKSKIEKGEEIQISEETRCRIYTEIRAILNHPGIEIKPDMHLAFDLGMDSLNIAELIMFVSKSYALEELHPEDLNTVHSVLEVAEGARGLTHAVRQGKFHWPLEKNRPHPAPPVGKTIPEAFLRSCDRMKNSMACADDLVGVLSYRKMKRSAIVLSFYFRKLPGAYVAVMLPASVGAYLAILAIQLAGKIPVMLNWTLGPRYLDEMMRATRAKTVISSWRFLERLSHVEFGSLIDKIELLEDTREKLSLGSKLKGALISLYSPSLILRSLHIDQIDENAQAVILFTSGTEANPKGVPLSHKNILSNQRSAMQCISLTKKDLLYGVLPPFHSFGFSVVGLFPICGGIKIAFYPDPTDGFAIAEGIERWKATLFCSPPTFLKGLLNAAKKEQLESIRLFVSGAEKAPLELFDRIKKLGTQGQLIEGYGITECSPIITISRLNLPHKGVGRPLPDIDICTIHLENQKLLPRGKEGEICVRGSNIFNGYLDSLRDPFIEIEGNEWYRTGDIGRLDEEGNLFLSGRIKRFTKIGGEMISLGSIEEALIKTFVESGKISADVPALALIVHEREQGQPQLILCSTVSIGREEVNQILQEVGFSHLVKISSVKKIEEIPLMGSGKIDYRRLESI